ncbi:MAG: anthranilate synthase component II [Thermoanaerobaculaceae bacterium]
MRVLLVENECSFTWNVVECLPCRREEVLLRPGRRACDWLPLLDSVDAVVVGPGPTDPVRAGLVDLVRAVAARGTPLLGICLGHQAVGLAFGARLTRVTPVHGKVSRIRFGPSRLFPGLAGPQDVMRYHSLALADVQPPLEVVAATADGVPMAVEHEALPVAGLQFHPDSYATPRGAEMLAAFFGAVR